MMKAGKTSAEREFQRDNFLRRKDEHRVSMGLVEVECNMGDEKKKDG